MMLKHGLVVGGMFLCLVAPAGATTITVDENGNGLPFRLGADPGPGGLANVLIYTLPFLGTQGDVGLTDADSSNLTLDIIRFNGNGTLIFYSDNLGGIDAIGDTAGPPTALYANLLRIPEIGLEGNNGAFYTPLPGQPGFDLSGPTYHFVSDGVNAEAVPEPATLTLVGTAVAGLVATRRRKAQKAPKSNLSQNAR